MDESQMYALFIDCDIKYRIMLKKDFLHFYNDRLLNQRNFIF